MGDHIIKHIESERTHSPFGDFYEWCDIISNDTLEFGDCQGSYQGGVIISFHGYASGNIPEDVYWKDVRNRLKAISKREPTLYNSIMEAIRDTAIEEKIKSIGGMYENMATK